MLQASPVDAAPPPPPEAGVGCGVDDLTVGCGVGWGVGWGVG